MGKASGLTEDRKSKIEKIIEAGVSLYPAGYHVDLTAKEALQRYQEMDDETLERESAPVSMAGRIMSRRDFGKASFLHIQDRTGQIQVYVRKNKVSEKDFNLFKLMDIGDYIGVKGPVFRTKTEELTVVAESLTLLTKSLRPLPEKWHGLTDVETRYRQRYLDLIMNEDVREVFVMRSRIIQAVQRIFYEPGVSGGGDPHDAAYSGRCNRKAV